MYMCVASKIEKKRNSALVMIFCDFSKSLWKCFQYLWKVSLQVEDDRLILYIWQQRNLAGYWEGGEEATGIENVQDNLSIIYYIDTKICKISVV